MKSIGALFHVVNDIERIGDHAENIADSARMRQERGVEFSKDAIAEMGAMMERVNDILRYAVEIFAQSKEEHMQDVIRIEDEIDNLEREYQQSHIDRLTKNECTPAAGMIFSDVISGLERVADHATNIAFAIVESEDE